MERAFKCNLCGEEFHSRHGLNAHLASQHAALPNRLKKQFKCNLCDYEATFKFNVIKHMRTHTGERPFKCTADDCDLAFTLKATLQKHMKRKHSDERPFKCNFPGCTYAAKTSENLIGHKKIHSDNKPFACSECDYKTIWKRDLKRHRMRPHSAKRDFKCSYPQCSKSFKSSIGLKLHSSNSHGERNITCDHPGCDQKCSNAKALLRHKQNVHSKKSLVCPFLNCSYRTNRSSDLTRHMIVHEGGKEKITCSIEGCPYKGKNRRALEEHMRLHKINLACPVSGCGGFAPTKKALEDHMKLHNPSDRPFQCPLCIKYYPSLPNLQRHCFVHTNEKPFECGHCEHAAPFRSKVKAHISSLHADIKFPFIIHLLDGRECLNCNMTLSTAEFLIHCKDHTLPVD